MDTAFKNFVFATELLDNRKTCKTCYHNRDSGCKLQSSGCATDVSKHKVVPREWLSYEEGEKREPARA